MTAQALYVRTTWALAFLAHSFGTFDFPGRFGFGFGTSGKAEISLFVANSSDTVHCLIVPTSLY